MPKSFKTLSTRMPPAAQARACGKTAGMMNEMALHEAPQLLFDKSHVYP